MAIIDPSGEPRRYQFDTEEEFEEATAAFWLAVDQAIDDRREQRYDREQ